MQQIFNFLIRNKNNILFLLLLILSLFLTIQSHSFHKSKFISSANVVTGGIYSWANNIQTYFHLNDYNKRLLDENKQLRSLLANVQDTTQLEIIVDSTIVNGIYKFRTARVINNNYSKVDNYITLDRGANSGIEKEFGVITSQGIVGIVDHVTEKHSRVISILNTNSRINAQLQKTNHFGSLVWNGKDPNLVQLIDVPRQAPVAVGDTIVTGGKSYIFPMGIPIGDIQDFTLDQNESYYTLNIRLFNDMTNIGHVYIIENQDKEELKALETDND
ncbi:rod shape-determining protein MreC [Antarcticibacterium sp. 1MA-6-2]|uniref:rod shape-determining protein MreC n=1 Tax=Antarcticibacterium sp. 1MA-6-2 TaxID=2908210 RepID=UPI001F25592B|nr:rod shape-determining protein MreC [Antarcticibacterium sp. 1MA-6-2]UJH89825.1 rod shape-determining protein MreC [Antarcticibacterium sp. 1MA-6-2]